MSELEDEGIRAILRRLDDIEKRLARTEAHLAGIAEGHVCWSYVDASGSISKPVLAGQTFANTIRVLVSDLRALWHAMPPGPLVPFRHSSVLREFNPASWTTEAIEYEAEEAKRQPRAAPPPAPPAATGRGSRWSP